MSDRWSGGRGAASRGKYRMVDGARTWRNGTDSAAGGRPRDAHGTQGESTHRKPAPEETLEVKRHHGEIEEHNRAIGMHKEYVFAESLRSDLRTGLTELLATLRNIRNRVRTEEATTESQRTDLSQAITDFERSVRDVDGLDSWEATADVVREKTKGLQEALAEMLRRSLRDKAGVMGPEGRGRAPASLGDYALVAGRSQ